MKSKSRFGIVSAVVVAIFALLYVLPALASDSETAKTASGGEVSVTGVYAGTTTLSTTLGAASISTDAKDTKVGNTIYVASGMATGDEKYNQVLVRIIDAIAGAGTSGGGNDSITVSVTNLTTTAKINDTRLTPLLTLNESSVEGTFQGSFKVVTLGIVPKTIVGADADIIRIDYSAAGLTQDLTVDAVKPSISAIGPANSTIQTSESAVFTAQITDGGSGLRADSALEDANDDGTTEAADRDGDGVADGATIGEPLPMVGTSGKTRDIGININIAAAGDGSIGGSKDESGLASTGWTVISDGFRFTFTKSGLGAGDTFWEVVAKDRVNNTAKTDADGPTLTNDAFKITVDLQSPGVSKAEAGIGYDSTLNKEIASASSIKLTWTENGGGGAADNLDTTTLDIGDFRVEKSTTDTTAHVITSVTHPNLSTTGTTTSKDLEGVAFDTRNITYVTLEQELVADSKPVVVVIGNIRDISGRAAPPDEDTALDKIKPALTITVTGSAASRPIAEGGTTGKITVRVVSDEALNVTPTANLVRFKLSTNAADVEVAGLSGVTLTAVSGATNTWEGTATAPASFEAALVAIHVRATDKATPSNAGVTAGLTDTGSDNLPNVGESADLSKMVLFEFDTLLVLATTGDQFVLTPSTTVGGTKTESASPFVRINFQESNEYPITNGTDSVDTFTFGTTTTVKVEIDTHDTVALTKLNLVDADGNSTDLLGTQGTIDDDSVVVALSSLAVGKYTIEVDGSDIAGNLLGLKKFAFEVVARADYSVALSPGFNLVSLPGDPADPSLDAVLPSTHPATTVLSYQPADPNGPWLVATRSAGANWSDNAANTLTEVRSGKGYWIQTGAFTALKTLVPERDPSQVLPTFPVVAGWNLVGVVDLTLGTTAATVTADAYLASIDWTIAYTFDTQSNKWTKVTKLSTPAGVLNNGQGLWVWSEKKDVLAP